MAVYPPSAARGFIAKKDNVNYDDTSASYLPDNAEKIKVNTPNKEYIVEGTLTLPAAPTGVMMCGGGKWNFEILEEK